MTTPNQIPTYLFNLVRLLILETISNMSRGPFGTTLRPSWPEVDTPVDSKAP